METRDVLLCIADDTTRDDTLSGQNPGTSIFASEPDQTSLGPSESSEQESTKAEQMTKKNTSVQQELQKQPTQVHSKPSVMTNIKGILSQQKEKSKRKSSKTPEKEKANKIQKHQKSGK